MSSVPLRSTIALLLFGLVACAGGLATIQGGPRPTWADGQADRLPAFEGKLTAVGIVQKKSGLSVEQALAELDASARAALIRKLQVTVSSELTATESAVDGVESSSVESRTREVVQAFDLQGVEIAARWQDEAAGVLYALAVLDKGAAAARLQAQMMEAGTVAEDFYERGESAIREGDAGAALLHFAKARTEAERAVQSAVLFRALTTRSADDIPSIPRYEARASALLNDVSVSVVDGDRQRTSDGKGLPRPVVFEARLIHGGKSFPLSGVPVSVSLDSGRYEAQPSTDASGRVSVQVLDVGTFAQPERVLSARVDWEGFARLAGVDVSRGIPAWLAGRPALEAKATVVKKSKETLRVIVKVMESIENGSTMSESLVQSAIVEALVGAKVVVQDPKALVDRVGGEAALATLSDEEIKEKARGLADVIVIGTAVSKFSSFYAEPAQWHRARGTIRAIDLGSGQVVANVDLEERGTRPGVNPDKAGQQALRALAGKISGKVSDALLAGLGF